MIPRGSHVWGDVVGIYLPTCVRCGASPALPTAPCTMALIHIDRDGEAPCGARLDCARSTRYAPGVTCENCDRCERERGAGGHQAPQEGPFRPVASERAPVRAADACGAPGATATPQGARPLPSQKKSVRARRRAGA